MPTLPRALSALAALLALSVSLLCASPALAQQPPRPDDQFQTLFQTGLEQLQRREFDASIDTFKKAMEIHREQPETYYNIACAYALKGEKDRAIDWFAQALERGFNDETHIEQDHDLDAIRQEPRFKEVMTRAFMKAKPGEALLTLKGEVASLDKLRGKVVILDFWRTWCEPAKQEIAALAELEREQSAHGLAVVGISNEPVPTQEQLADDLKINFLLLRQVGPLPQPYDNVRAFPTLFVLDTEGKVVKKLVGAKTKAEIEEAIQPLLPKEKKESQVF
ncbi:MAG TPA: redoxin domain-containing protein [Planctomycetota bacterium]|nr:redoxin domain-containing protein [Planctomycetota bacterium]